MIALDLHLISIIILAFAWNAILYFRKRKTHTKQYFIWAACFSLYILLLIKITICPVIYLRPENRPEFLQHVGSAVSYTQFIPGKTIMSAIETGNWFFQVLGNILLFVPLPVFLRLRKASSVLRLLGIGCMVSIFIECMQLGINIIGGYPSHIMDIDDLLLNTLGALLGALFACTVSKHRFFRDAIKNIRGNPHGNP